MLEAVRGRTSACSLGFRPPATAVQAIRWVERFVVAISGLRVRLEQLGLLYVSEHGRLYASRAEAAGQLKMW